MFHLIIQVGIPVFVTGGIGGVHRHGETSKNIFFFIFYVILKKISRMYMKQLAEATVIWYQSLVMLQFLDKRSYMKSKDVN